MLYLFLINRVSNQSIKDLIGYIGTNMTSSRVELNIATTSCVMMGTTTTPSPYFTCVFFDIPEQVPPGQIGSMAYTSKKIN